MHRRFESKVVMVFGAGSSGPGWSNGKAASVLYAREGATVVAIDLEPAAAEETRAIIEAEGGSAIALATNVTNGEAVANAVDEVFARYGRIDVLHNNVGITGMGTPVNMSEAQWQRVFDVNVNSVFLTCKYVLPVMLKQGSGAIINISSLAAEQILTYPYMAYNASKAAVNQFTRALAVEYAAQGIRVNAIMPGMMDTPLVYKQIASSGDNIDALIASRNAAVPMKRMGDAWDVAKAALSLASDDAAYINGVCLPVDGGKSCVGS